MPGVISLVKQIMHDSLSKYASCVQEIMDKYCPNHIHPDSGGARLFLRGLDCNHPLKELFKNVDSLQEIRRRLNLMENYFGKEYELVYCHKRFFVCWDEDTSQPLDFDIFNVEDGKA